MDVHCSSCGEPWDTHHLRHQAIWETSLTDEEIAECNELPQAERLSGTHRGALEAAGYVVGRTLFNLVHCPSCPPGAKPDPNKAALKAELEQALGDDMDGLAASFEDLGL